MIKVPLRKRLVHTLSLFASIIPISCPQAPSMLTTPILHHSIRRLLKNEACVDEGYAISVLSIGLLIDHPAYVPPLVQVYDRRYRVARHFARQDPHLKASLKTFWKYATPDVMSGDETDHSWQGPLHQKPHFVLIIDWRNPEVLIFFRILDGLYFSTRFEHDGRIDSGRFPNTRVRCNIVVKGKVVRGLPRNFYNPEWLKLLTPSEIDDLEMRPSIELNFAPKTLSYVLVLLSRKIIKPGCFCFQDCRSIYVYKT